MGKDRHPGINYSHASCTQPINQPSNGHEWNETAFSQLHPVKPLSGCIIAVPVELVRQVHEVTGLVDEKLIGKVTKN